jgi:hypothetical protein
VVLKWIPALLGCEKGGEKLTFGSGGRTSFSNTDVILKFTIFRGRWRNAKRIQIEVECRR